MIRYYKRYYGTEWEGDEYVGDSSMHDNKWSIVCDDLNTIKSTLVKVKLTEAEADAFLKLLRS